ncbi:MULTISPECIES: antitoxin Xre/MbcA/ParS toxin-binding domain-containing protein [unclassified Rhodococcus (in: high G+C Gram-positive bacteria)]|uniref:antitoxin Xre/MbcA/ParS toxin-binding domain-containing protein n=1 Tax=unclassified Rhodococcus (in: high G+C Gram-positive bacteria) TaxID=192944 RepID=UPI001BD0FBBE|nr:MULTISPECIES: antitoxin Xre/MbcA/ParS toxin-binding domain-containing protein [unclassified Rhodococcus (in: high G+C Gram-positive bacteria)]QYB04261.1 MbcA/ParS/Xre antitoxin family protein [Rhodococcus sp. USK10]
MPTDLLTRTSEDTTRLETHEVAKYLLDHFGRTFTAFVAGSRSRALPARWALAPGEPNHVTPAVDKVRRLRAAHTLATAIDQKENDQVARAWLIAANPRLGGASPAELIREDEMQRVFAAAKAFLEGSYNA